MSEAPQRPHRNAPRPSRFVQSCDSGPIDLPRTTVMPGFSGVNPRANVSTSKDSISTTPQSRAKGGSALVARQTLGEEAAVQGEDGRSGDGAATLGRKPKEGSSCSRTSSSSSSSSSGSSSSVVGVDQGQPDPEGEWSDRDSDFDLDGGSTSAVPTLPPPPGNASRLETGDETSAPRAISSTPPAGAGRAVGVVAAPPAAVLAALAASSSPRDPSSRVKSRQVDKREKSLQRVKGKTYGRWPATLLRFACSTRGIIRMTRETDQELMSDLLQAEDNKQGRTSPYVDDLWGDVDGDGDNDNGIQPLPSEPVPEGAVLMLRTAMKQQSFSVDPNTTLKFSGKDYMGSDLLAVIKKEDAAADVGETSVNTRRTKHCFLRLICFICSDKFRGEFLQARLQCSRQELDNKETGKNRGVWRRIAADFRDKECEVANITDDCFISDLDPNLVMQPEATAKKLYDLYNEVKAAWNPLHANFKKSGSHAAWKSFCPGNRNVWIFGVAVELYPSLIEVCSNFLPDDVAREISGTRDGDEKLGSTGTVGGDKKRRADSKIRAAEASVRVGTTSGKKAKAEESASRMAAHFKDVVATVVEAFKPEPMGVESAARDSRPQTADDACVHLSVLDAFMLSHDKCLESLDREEAKGGNANPMRFLFLKQQAAGLEKKLVGLMDTTFKTET